ncbi:MAG: hypothetical protein CSA54_04795, partial [Gammaproteobacteria bacterium]
AVEVSSVQPFRVTTRHVATETTRADLKLMRLCRIENCRTSRKKPADLPFLARSKREIAVK